MPKRDMAWWFWLTIDMLLVASLLVDRRMLVAVIAVAAVQVPLFIRRSGAWNAFPVQVRMAYLALLVIGAWHPLGFVHWIQLAGTTAMLLSGYCFLARCLSLLPFNRSEPLTMAFVVRTFFTRPIAGSIATRQAHIPPVADRC